MRSLTATIAEGSISRGDPRPASISESNGWPTATPPMPANRKPENYALPRTIRREIRSP